MPGVVIVDGTGTFVVDRLLGSVPVFTPAFGAASFVVLIVLMVDVLDCNPRVPAASGIGIERHQAKAG